MDERNESDQPGQPAGPDTDDSGNPTDAAPGSNAADSGAGDHGDHPRSAAGREMLVQLQQMIDTLATQAGPVMREVAAKSAELAVIAAEKAGPLAHKAAEATDSFSQRMAARSKEWAADLRRPPAEATEEGASPGQGSESDQATADWPSERTDNTDN